LLPFGGLTKKYIAALALLLLGAGTAHAANCDALPNTLTNGQTADASQVMANFNTLMSCADNNLLAIANSLSEIASGGSSAQRTARTNLGFTGPGIVIGSAGGSYTSPTTANTNILLYDNSATNWAGIGSDVSGRTYFVTEVTAPAARLVIGLNGGIFTPGATGGDVGAQAINSAAGYYTNGVRTDVQNITPASSSAPCTQGNFAADANYVYFCAGTNHWVRAALSGF
jgi:hypothetical protein